MKLLSTRGRSAAADLRSALLRGLAPDGGLYLPERLEPLDGAVVESLRGRSFAHASRIVAHHLLRSELSREELDGLVDEAFDFPVPLVPVERDVYVLELFHGPTLAFKDVGARFMARLLGHYTGDGGPPLTVLVATSGDTGSAVAQAFLGVAGVRTVVLFPSGKVSPLQERQFTTLGGNVQAVEVEGTFDDCQSLVKTVFKDEALRGRVRLTSANSINIGRLLPQIFYYFHAWAQLPENTPAPLFSTPSGNFGNLTGGLLARRLGLPVRGFVAATNVNDTVPEYLATGLVRPRPSIPTLSSAMDVGDPSNLDRILALYRGDPDALRADVVGSVHDDRETRACIARTFARAAYTLDPHSAVGYLGVEAGIREFGEGPAIVLATAHPVKFRKTVEMEIGQPVPVPERLAARLEAERSVRRIDPDADALAAVLLAS